MAQMVKNLPAVQETQVQSQGREHTLEKEMATHSGILAGRIPWTEEPGRLQSMGWQESDTTERLHFQSSNVSPPCPFPGNHKFAFYICDSNPAL